MKNYNNQHSSGTACVPGAQLSILFVAFLFLPLNSPAKESLFIPILWIGELRPTEDNQLAQGCVAKSGGVGISSLVVRPHSLGRDPAVTCLSSLPLTKEPTRTCKMETGLGCPLRFRAGLEASDDILRTPFPSHPWGWGLYLLPPPS